MCTHFNNLIVANDAADRVMGGLDDMFGVDWVDRVELDVDPQALTPIDYARQLTDDSDGELWGRIYRLPEAVEMVFHSYSELLCLAVHSKIVERREQLAADRVGDEVTAPPAVEIAPVKATVAA
jgi:hypothetical protein